MAVVAKELRQRARALRNQPSDAERTLWRFLCKGQVHGWRFRRPHPIPPYIADFACIEAKLIVEADGGQHAESEYDARRTQYLERLGWRVLRFWNDEILKHRETVAEVIGAALGPHPNPPPLREGGDTTATSKTDLDGDDE